MYYSNYFMYYIYNITLLKVTVSGLERLLDKPWHICASNATTGEGLQEGIEWLTGEQDTWQSCDRGL